MKELLSIEQKAKRYDEAIERAKEMIKAMTNIGGVAKVDDIQYLFPELKESKDERIRKVIYGWIYTQPSQFFDNGFSKEEMLTWLEKQGNPTEDELEALRMAAYEPTKNWSEKLQSLYEKLTHCEQKPANRVKPKFKVGDWVVSPNGVYWHVDAISNNRYEVSSVTGECADWPLSTNLYHPWTIQDAKPGDIIATLDYILIFKDHLEKEGGISYCHYDFGADNPQFIWLEDNNWYFGKKAVLSPATKEQRDLLFQKMSEAGYEWDPKKLELRKIIENSLKKGNWYVCIEDLSVGLGTDFNKGEVYYCSVDGCLKNEISKTSISIGENSYRCFKPWSIKDAKPGDILANDHHILILKELGYSWASTGMPESVYAYCGIKPDGTFELGKEHYCFCGTLYMHPATKEQQDLLEQKMYEASYVWDPEKLELKKESYEYPLCNSIKDKIDYYIFNHFTLDKVVTTDVNSIVKAMKEGVRLGQESTEWNKEDEENSTYVCAALDAYYRLREEKNNTSGQEKLDAAVAWLNNRLKSLKPKEFNPVIEHRQKLYEIIDTAEHHCFLSLEDIEYLRKLRDINPYDKVWNEEDDKFFEELYKEIEQGYEDANIEQLKDIYSRQLRWLESIKSRLT